MNSLSEKCGFLGGGLDHGQADGRPDDLQRNGRRTTAGTQVEPGNREILERAGSQEWLDQKPVERGSGEVRQGKGREVEPSIPPAQELVVLLQTLEFTVL